MNRKQYKRAKAKAEKKAIAHAIDVQKSIARNSRRSKLADMSQQRYWNKLADMGELYSLYTSRSK